MGSSHCALPNGFTGLGDEQKCHEHCQEDQNCAVFPEHVSDTCTIYIPSTASTYHPSPKGGRCLGRLSGSIAGASSISCPHSPSNLALNFRNLLAAEIAS